MRRFSIKTKVTLLATLFFLTALGLLSAIQLYYIKGEMQRVLADQQLGFVSRVADEIDQKLSLNLDALVAAAGVIPPQAMNDARMLEKILAERVVLRTLFNDLFVYSGEGIVLADLPALGRRGMNVSDQENFRGAMASGKGYISKPFVGRFLKQPVVSMTAPIFDKEGNIIGVLSGSLSLVGRNFLGNLGEAKVGKTGSFALFTRDRMIVVSRDKERIMTRGPPRGVSPYFDNATSGRDGSEEGVNSRGLHAIYSYSQLEKLPWVLVASLPIQEAYAPVQATQRRIIEVTLVLALLIAPAIWYGAGRLLRPLLVLRDTIRRFRDNPETTQAVPVTRADEIGDLATDFNDMVDARRRAAEERNRANAELSGKNIELENALKAKDRFLATMSHELRTPLNAILGFTGTLLMRLPGSLNAGQEKQLQTVQTSARHLLALINDLLDLAKIDAGKIELNLELMDCGSVIEEAAATLRPMAEQKGLRFEFAGPGGALLAQTDRRALTQIALNLINNAIKFTERGSVEVEINLRGSGVLEVGVKDTGIGIRAEDQSKVFEAFTQFDPTARRQHEGTGLGLHLSQKLAGLLGGSIRMRSDYGKGSTFTLCLPLSGSSTARSASPPKE
jgi:two-component system sensor histidine kinase/response regulator